MSEPVAVPSRRKPSRGKVIVALLVPLVIVGVLVFAFMKDGAERREILENGASAVGVPTGKVLVESQRDGNRSEQAQRLEYRFIVDGTSYTAAGDQSYDRDFFELNDALRANRTAEVWYLPDDPSRAIVLDKDYR